MTLSFGGISLTSLNIANILATVANIPALPALLNPIFPPIASNGLPAYF
ncbi:Uncharacterised protein [Chlamydia trachomatis]|nr:Uncharacterised protein [Chlamydia trachomatis]